MTLKLGSSLDERSLTDIANRILATYDARSQIASIAAEIEAFDLAAAYRICTIVRQLREARGEHPIGRKLGFTNRNIRIVKLVNHFLLRRN